MQRSAHPTSPFVARSVTLEFMCGTLRTVALQLAAASRNRPELKVGCHLKTRAARCHHFVQHLGGSATIASTLATAYYNTSAIFPASFFIHVLLLQHRTDSNAPARTRASVPSSHACPSLPHLSPPCQCVVRVLCLVGTPTVVVVSSDSRSDEIIPTSLPFTCRAPGLSCYTRLPQGDAPGCVISPDECRKA